MNEEKKERTFVSTVIYLHDIDADVLDFIKKLYSIFSVNFENFELLIVNDLCSDSTIANIKEWARLNVVPLTILHMSLYHGLEDAMNAGIDVAIGDVIYEFDVATMPYESNIILEAYKCLMNGNDIVSVCPRDESWSSRFFYKIFNNTSGSIYPLHTDAFRLVTRRMINRVHSSHVFMPYRKAEYVSSGLKNHSIFFNGKVENRHRHKVSLAIDGLALYTHAAYKLSIGVTFFMMMVTIIELIYVLIVYLIGRPIVGWTTTMLVISFGFLGLFVLQSIIIKYLSLNLELSFRKKKYLVEYIEKI